MSIKRTIACNGQMMLEEHFEVIERMSYSNDVGERITPTTFFARLVRGNLVAELV